MRSADLTNEITFGGQDVEGNAFEKFKQKFPNLSTLMYFIPGLGQSLMAADIVSQIQMYNQAIAKIEQTYPPQTIQAAQQRVGDPIGDIEPMDFNEGYVNYWGKPKPKFTAMELALMEGGHSLENNNEKTISNFGNKPIRMQFLAGLHSQSLGRKPS